MTGQSGPLILDHNLQPVWFNPIGVNALAANLQVQSYNGKPVLSWWQGVVTAAGVTTSGEDVVVDQHYRHVATLKGADGWVISQHEMLISGQNAWVTAYKNVPMNLTPYGGSAKGVVLDSAVQEYNLATGQLLYTWDALNPGGTPNVPLSQSKQKAFPGRSVGRLPHQLDPAGRRRDLPRVAPQHVVGVPGQPAHERNRVDAERGPEAQHVRAAEERPSSSGSTTSSCTTATWSACSTTRAAGSTRSPARP